MCQLNSAKEKALAALVGVSSGQIDDLENQWLLMLTGEVSGDTQDLWLTYLISEGVAQSNLNDMFYEWLTSLGYLQPQLNEKWTQFWCDRPDGIESYGGSYSAAYG